MLYLDISLQSDPLKSKLFLFQMTQQSFAKTNNYIKSLFEKEN